MEVYSLSKTNNCNLMRYFVSHSAIAQASVPSVKELAARIKIAHPNAWYVGCMGFHEFANEQDYKDFCG